MNGTRKYPSPQQRQLLVQLVEADPELRSGKFSSQFTKKMSVDRWRDIANQLNALNGVNKLWEGWRKTWQDRKSNAKKKIALARRQANLTGGGPPPKPPTIEDLLVLSTMPSSALIGHSASQESVVEIINFDSVQDHIEGQISVQDHIEGQITVQETQDAGQNVPKGYIKENTVHMLIEPETQQKRERSNRRVRGITKQKRSEALKTAERINQLLKEKKDMKKTFFAEFIDVMKLQCAALNKIADAIEKKKH